MADLLSRDRLGQALAYAPTDEILGSRALTMPGFAQVADQLIARAHARRQRNAPGKATSPDGGMSWPEARGALERAIQRHGRGGRGAALAELAAADGRFAEFVRRVGWPQLCEQPFQYADRRYAELWAELARSPHPAKEAPA